MLVQSGGCCDGSSPICFRAGAFLVGPDDRLLGDIAGAAFYIDSDQDERWNGPQLVLDVAHGAAEGLSLEALEGIHFVTLSAVSAAPYFRAQAIGRGAVLANTLENHLDEFLRPLRVRLELPLAWRVRASLAAPTTWQAARSASLQA